MWSFILIINSGIKKDELILKLNNVKFKDLNNNLMLFVKQIFPDVKYNDLIRCKKSNYSKINMVLTVGCESKNISIKTGSSSVIYKDSLFNFVMQLASLNVSSMSLKSIMLYHFADGTIDGSGSSYDFGNLLKNRYKNEIDIVKKEFTNKDLLSRFIDAVLIKERSNRSVDFFYYGNSKKG